MTSALLALFLAGATASPAPPAQPIEILEAAEVDYDAPSQRVSVRGGVALRRGLVLLRAESADYDAVTGEVDARGGVLLTEPGRAVAAEALHAVLDGPYRARDVVAYLKAGPLDLSMCRTVGEARARGQNRLTVAGLEVTGESDAPAVEVESASVTLCDCGAGPPSWQLRAKSATVVPNDHVWLRWPVLYITPRFLFWHRRLLGRDDVPAPIPVLPLPFLYLPLTDRQTGLLLPQFTYGGVAGTSLGLPFFLTLGRSWDATLTPARYFGSDRVKGWGEELELRWAPAEGVSGRARLHLVHSTLDWPAGVPRPPGDIRLALSVLHDQRLSAASYLKVDLGLVGDPLYTSDFNADALLRVLDYRRSAVVFTHRREDLVFAAEADYHLPLSGLNACPGGTCQPAPFGPFGADVPVFHRLPSASLTLLPVGLSGPLHLGGTFTLARFAPIHGITGDEGSDGFGPGERNWPAVVPDPGEGDGVWQRTERLAAARAVARVELRAPLLVERALLVEPWVAGTAGAYALSAGQGSQGDARATAGLTLSTELSRRFGEGAGMVRHRIEPRLALVTGSGQAGPALPNYAYDELDVSAPLAAVTEGQRYVRLRRNLSALPGGSFEQLQLSLRSRLSAPAVPLSLDLALGQDLDLGQGALSESWAQAALRLGLLSFDALARFYAFGAGPPLGSGPVTTSPELPPSFLDAFTSLQGGLTLADRRGDNVHATFLAVGKGGSPRLLAGLEPIFDRRPVAFDALAVAGVGAAARLSGLGLSYEASAYARELGAPPCAGKSTRPHFYQQAVGMVWDSPCKCWRVGVSATFNECIDKPQIQLLVDLSSLAGGGFAR